MTEVTDTELDLTTLAGLNATGAAIVQVGLAGEKIELVVEEALTHAHHVLEAAAVAEIESAMFRWLVSDTRKAEDVDEQEARARAFKIIYGFRRFRSDEAPYPVIGGDPDGAQPGPVHEPIADAGAGEGARRDHVADAHDE